jgi:hypothetical protein
LSAVRPAPARFGPYSKADFKWQTPFDPGVARLLAGLLAEVPVGIRQGVKRATFEMF